MSLTPLAPFEVIVTIYVHYHLVLLGLNLFKLFSETLARSKVNTVNELKPGIFSRPSNSHSSIHAGFVGVFKRLDSGGMNRGRFFLFGGCTGIEVWVGL